MVTLKLYDQQRYKWTCKCKCIHSFSFFIIMRMCWKKNLSKSKIFDNIDKSWSGRNSLFWNMKCICPKIKCQSGTAQLANKSKDDVSLREKKLFWIDLFIMHTVYFQVIFSASWIKSKCKKAKSCSFCIIMRNWMDLIRIFPWKKRSSDVQFEMEI